jgi:hypothetical protein
MTKEILQSPFPEFAQEEAECAVTLQLRVQYFSAKFQALKITLQTIPFSL